MILVTRKKVKVKEVAKEINDAGRVTYTPIH